MDAVQNQIPVTRVVDNLGEDVQRAFYLFLKDFKLDGQLKYIEVAQRLTNLDKCSLPVNYKDLMSYDQSLSTNIHLHYYRVYPYLCNATKQFVRESLTDTDCSSQDYICHFTDFPQITKLRNLKTSYLGKLTKFRGQVVRSHSVNPELVLGTFKCSDCDSIIQKIEQQFIYTQPSRCGNPHCQNRTKFEMITKSCDYVDFQKVRVQETQEELPRGSVPRSLDIILHYDTVELAQPGDLSEFTGTLIVVPDVGQMALPGSKTVESKPIKPAEGYDIGVTGIKSLGVREMSYKLAFLACHVSPINNKFLENDEFMNTPVLTQDSIRSKMTDAEIQKVLDMSQDPKLAVNLSQSLFPNIYGNDEVKRGLLLSLFAGVPKTTEEETKLRGDINILLVGDPSTAKSQFLKRIDQFSDRSVYTSGKASTAAGLTAAVVKDQESSDFVIEAGALMLANNGICCIDEFDKMDIRDQVAIHEAMEQQTITLTKAGIRATLNARCSIMAAANPVSGRYDRSRSLRQNINLSAPIMSRFDLFFVLVDESNEQVDYEIARKIVSLHATTDSNVNQQQQGVIYSEDDIRRYLTFARCFDPMISDEASRQMVVEYKKMRERETNSGNQSAWRMTIRQMESLIRLSEATARMHLSDYVTEQHVTDAVRLLTKSIVRIEQPDINLIDSEPVIPDAVAPDDAMEVESEKLNISFEEFTTIMNGLISHLRIIEADDLQNIRKSDLISWYLESIIDTIPDGDSLAKKKIIVERIIQRLIERDNVLMAIGGHDLDAEQSHDPIIIIHPNVPLD